MYLTVGPDEECCYIPAHCRDIWRVLHHGVAGPGRARNV